MRLNASPKRRRGGESEQLALDFRVERRGGRRKGAGRKPAAERKGFVKHVPRPLHDEETPVHVVVRVRRDVPYLRSQRIFAVLRAMFARASEKGLRLLHFSVQANHLHLIVEATDGATLGRGMQRLLSRIALAINAIARRRGKVFRDRYFRQDLKSPTQVRNALVYVMFNVQKHDTTRDWTGGLDTYSSSVWFRDWAPDSAPTPSGLLTAGPPIVAEPRSWLARTGWRVRGGGPIRLDAQVRSI
jgi:REP element-mobilizing transposase RayT